MSKKVNWSVLAFMRFYLAAMVALYHLPPFIAHDDWGNFISPYLPGYAAVLVFLLISGYSIAHSVTTNPAGFYRRRLERVYPVYFVSILTACIAFAIFGPAITTPNTILEAPHSVWVVVANFLMLQGTFSDHLNTNQVTWSLSIECLFYLLAPYFARMSTKSLLILWGCSAICYLIPASLHIPEPNSAKFGLGALMMLWAWLIGFLIYRHQSEYWIWALCFTTGGFLISNYDLGKCAFSGYIYMLAVIIIMTIRNTPAKFDRIAAYLGDLSYPLYLMHFPVMVLLGCTGRIVPSWLLILGDAVATLMVYHLIDKPYRAYAKRRHVSKNLLHGVNAG